MPLANVLATLNDAVFPSATAAYVGAAVSVAPAGGWSASGAGRAVNCWSTTAGYWKVGNGVTATASDLPVPANTPVNIKVPVNVLDGWGVSFFPITVTGNAYATPIGLE